MESIQKTICLFHPSSSHLYIVAMVGQYQSLMEREDKGIDSVEDTSSNNSMIKNTRYYYPAERDTTCCFGKGNFKPRFPKHMPANEPSMATKFCKIMCIYCFQKKVNEPNNQVELERLLPIRNPRFTSSEDRITYTWIGHSTAVLAIGTKVNLIIDPVFSMRCSPVQFAGPKRYRLPACEINQLPPIHAVLVSHDHYDHLDSHSLSTLEELHKPVFIAGLDSEDEFPKGCRLVELDWTLTKEVVINGQTFEITFVPVCHWSKRKLWEKNTRLWGGFVIKTPKGQKIFYSGDTAYCEIFKEVGDLFGPFDLAILPIGAYEPKEIMESSHNNPEEAVQMHLELRSKKTVGVHWGTFPLGFQHWHKPKEDLAQAKLKLKVKEDQFIAMAHGDEFSIDYL